MYWQFCFEVLLLAGLNTTQYMHIHCLTRAWERMPDETNFLLSFFIPLIALSRFLCHLRDTAPLCPVPMKRKFLLVLI